MIIRYKKLHPDAQPPMRAHQDDAGADLAVCLDEPRPNVTIEPGQTMLVPTGIAIELSPGFEGQVRPRSSVSRDGLLVHTGTIDSSYRGQISVIVSNVGKVAQSINHGRRIAQLVIAPVVLATFQEAEELNETKRGSGAFGSTDKPVRVREMNVSGAGAVGIRIGGNGG